MKTGLRQKNTGPAYRLDDGTVLLLRSNMGEGGEGLVYDTNLPNMVAKIYLPDSPANEEKLKQLIDIFHRSTGSYNFLANFCLPQKLIYDSNGRCAGYLMRKFKGETLADVLLQDNLTARGWTRMQLASLALGIIRSLRYLRLFNMLMGDINLRNILVSDDGDYAIIDTDSFQIGNRYKCGLGRPEFTSPRYLAASARGEFFRKESDENYAISTLIFHILMPEKSPFMSVTGRNRAQALKLRKFVFPEGYGNVNTLAMGTERMWYDLPQPIRAAFCSVYNDGIDISPEKWEKLLEDYNADMANLGVTSTIFPRTRAEMPRLLSLRESNGFDSTPGMYALPRTNDSDKSDFAIVYLDSDNILGLYNNSWPRAQLRTPKFHLRNFLRKKVFDRIDACGRIDASELAKDLSYSPTLHNWYKSLAPHRPMVTRIYALAGSLLRNIENGDEVAEAIEKATGWHFNIPSLDRDNDIIARAVIEEMEIDRRVGKYIVYVDDKVSSRLLFCRPDGTVKCVILHDCGRRIMRNRFIYTAGLERTPEAAWDEHDSACGLLVNELTVPSGFEGAEFVVVGLPRLGNISGMEELQKRRSEFDADILVNRHRVGDYLDDFKMSDDMADEFEHRLAIPLISSLSQRMKCCGLKAMPLEIYQIKTIMTLEKILS